MAALDLRGSLSPSAGDGCLAEPDDDEGRLGLPLLPASSCRPPSDRSRLLAGGPSGSGASAPPAPRPSLRELVVPLLTTASLDLRSRFRLWLMASGGSLIAPSLTLSTRGLPLSLSSFPLLPASPKDEDDDPQPAADALGSEGRDPEALASEADDEEAGTWRAPKTRRSSFRVTPTFVRRTHSLSGPIASISPSSLKRARTLASSRAMACLLSGRQTRRRRWAMSSGERPSVHRHGRCPPSASRRWVTASPTANRSCGSRHSRAKLPPASLERMRIMEVSCRAPKASRKWLEEKEFLGRCWRTDSSRKRQISL